MLDVPLRQFVFFSPSDRIQFLLSATYPTIAKHTQLLYAIHMQIQLKINSEIPICHKMHFSSWHFNTTFKFRSFFAWTGRPNAPTDFVSDLVIFGTLINCAVITIFDCWFYGEFSIFDRRMRVCGWLDECMRRSRTMDWLEHSTVCTQQINKNTSKKKTPNGSTAMVCGSFECFPLVFELNLEISDWRVEYIGITE